MSWSPECGQNLSESKMPSRLKQLLTSVGLYRPARYLASLPYRQLAEYRTEINGAEVRFHTRDARSNAWFYPRYRNGRLHEAPITRKLIDELQNKKCFIDVGAHIGWYACVAATLFPDLQVTAFEMDDSTADLLEANAKLNSNAIDVQRLALTDSVGTVAYRCPTDRPFSENRIEPSGPATNQSESTSLDQFAAENQLCPDLIKIDVEGTELQTLKGMQRVIDEFRPALFVEVHPENLPLFGSRPEDVMQFLEDRDYEVSSVAHKLKHDIHSTQPTMLVARPSGSGV